jgi:hypothetical protein
MGPFKEQATAKAKYGGSFPLGELSVRMTTKTDNGKNTQKQQQKQILRFAQG